MALWATCQVLWPDRLGPCRASRLARARRFLNGATALGADPRWGATDFAPPKRRLTARRPQLALVSHDLIDTAEMYLRTIYELLEEGVVPMRARIAERLEQSNPTVSQTVARLERDGLLTVAADDRHLELTEQGYHIAVAVMRKHRLAERLLTDVLGLDLADVHEEACRWEHVISDNVERRLLEMLDGPWLSPFGNPIPGIDLLTGNSADTTEEAGGVSIRSLAAAGVRTARVVRIAEFVQHDEQACASVIHLGLLPGREIGLAPDGDSVVVSVDGAQSTLTPLAAAGIWALRV